MRFLVAIRAAIADDQHAQMAHSPAVLMAYSSLRAALAGQGTFDPKVGAALTLASAAGAGNGYMTRIASRLAQMNGWTEEQVSALTKGAPTSDAKIDSLTWPRQGGGGKFGQRC
jgi:hypothetical protein